MDRLKTMFAVAMASSILIDGLKNNEPCHTNSILDFTNERYKDSTRNDICDRFIIPSSGKWYRAQAQDLATSPPFTIQSCGTFFPIWLNGSVPKTLHKTIDSVACVVGAGTDCDETINIRVRNCGKYNVYFLRPPSSCPVAYCFEFTEGRPTTEKTEKPTVTALLNEKQYGRSSVQELQFKCNFRALTTDYFYQIQWFIDDKESFLAPARPHHLLGEDTYLIEDENDDSLGYTRLGINVQCLVRLLIDTDGPLGPTSDKSDNLFAGIEVTKEITIKRGQPGVIELRPTVPFGCLLNGNNPIPCNLSIEMYVPRNSKSCNAEIKAKNAYFCAYQISNTQWSKSTNVSFLVGETGSYKINNPDGFRIGFKTQDRRLKGNVHWGNYILSEAHVHVVEEDEDIWIGKKCQAHSDPHILTFDQKSYENQNPGKFILYRGRDPSYITEVQVEHTRCFIALRNQDIYPYCVCATAVRAGNDLFVIDRCPNRRLTLGFKSCGENVLEARKVNEFEYMVFFPTGMYVHILIDDNYFDEQVKTMNINIYPSVKDKNSTTGLCGTLNKYSSDDFEDRNKNVVDENDFIDAWRVKPLDDDLIGISHEEALNLPSWPEKSVYCTCPTGPNKSSYEGEKLNSCSSSNMVECSKNEHKKISTRRCFVRHRRSLLRTFSYQPDNVVFAPNTMRTKKVKWSVPLKVWTKQEAMKYCKDFMEKSVTFKACQDIPNTQPDVSLENCALDIVLTNSTDWADLSRRTIRMSCMKELKDNNTLAEPGKNETESIADKIKAISCPSDCSSHGTCKNGTCACDVGFGAHDCSMDLAAPPDVYGINTDDGGICDITDCPSAFVEGDGFLDSKDLKCKLQYFEADMNNNITVLHNIVVNGEHDSLAEVHCPLPNRGRRATTKNNNGFVHGYMISISNNNRKFSSSHPLYFLDGRCQDTVNITGKLGFIVKDNYCYIGASCIAHGTFQPYNKCCRCDSRISPVTWTLVPGCRLPGSKTDTFSDGGIAGLSVGIIILLVVFVASGFVLYKFKRASKTTETVIKFPRFTKIYQVSRAAEKQNVRTKT